MDISVAPVRAARPTPHETDHVIPVSFVITASFVIPAQAGIQRHHAVATEGLDPRLRGDDGVRGDDNLICAGTTKWPARR